MSDAKISEAAEQARNFIGELCGPGKMSKAEAVDFLEVVIADCEGSVDALKEEMGDDE
jgi:hypothetical protein